jgi:hypothetical protein
MPVAYRVTSPTNPPQSREYVEVRSPEIPNLGARGQELEEISRSAHLSSERGSPGPALSDNVQQCPTMSNNIFPSCPPCPTMSNRPTILFPHVQPCPTMTMSIVPCPCTLFHVPHVPVLCPMSHVHVFVSDYKQSLHVSSTRIHTTDHTLLNSYSPVVASISR